MSFESSVNNHIPDKLYDELLRKLKRRNQLRGKFNSVYLKDNKIYYQDKNKPYDDRQIIPQSKVNDVIREWYISPKKGLIGRDALYKRLREHYIGISREAVMKFLKSQETHQLNYRVPKQTSITRIIIKVPDYLYCADLIDMSKYKRYNNNTTFILNCIDAYSKIAYSIPLKSKGALDVKEAFKTIFNITKPKMLLTDRGPEFTNKQVEAFFKHKDIKHILTSPYKPTSNSLCERFNGTIKSMIKRYMGLYKTHKYIDVLDDIVDNYNEHLKNPEQRKDNRKIISEKNDLKKGDSVRIYMRSLVKYRKNKLAKPPYNFTKEIYTIKTYYKTQDTI